jgi:hypothetical protein
MNLVIARRALARRSNLLVSENCFGRPMSSLATTVFSASFFFLAPPTTDNHITKFHSRFQLPI